MQQRWIWSFWAWKVSRWTPWKRIKNKTKCKQKKKKWCSVFLHKFWMQNVSFLICGHHTPIRQAIFIKYTYFCTCTISRKKQRFVLPFDSPSDRLHRTGPPGLCRRSGRLADRWTGRPLSPPRRSSPPAASRLTGVFVLSPESQKMTVLRQRQALVRIEWKGSANAQHVFLFNESYRLGYENDLIMTRRSTALHDVFRPTGLMWSVSCFG